MNSIEASYRAEIKDLFAAHFGRFEEKLERRTAETAARFGRFEEKLEGHAAETAAHFERFEEKLEHRLAETAAHFERFQEKIEHRLTATQAELRVEIHSVKADLIKWTFVFWAPVALAVIGLYFKT